MNAIKKIYEVGGTCDVLVIIIIFLKALPHAALGGAVIAVIFECVYTWTHLNCTYFCVCVCGVRRLRNCIKVHGNL